MAKRSVSDTARRSNSPAARRFPFIGQPGRLDDAPHGVRAGVPVRAALAAEEPAARGDAKPILAAAGWAGAAQLPALPAQAKP